MNIKNILFVGLFFPFPIFSQSTAQKFIEALIYDKENITDFINKDELASSKRLGISYDGVKNKVLIGVEIPEEIKEGIRSSKYQYTVKEEPLSNGYTFAAFSVPSANYEKLYYFDGGFVSASTYHTRLWEKKESKYFRFRISEPLYFNDYCITRLDDFVDMIADTLGFTISEKTLLEKVKIFYTFCRDENEVKKITGYGAKGMALLGNDEIVTSYQTHFHEVAHILINYKLKQLGLYTLPFFMEGFAVTVGGRGGMAPRVVTDIGYYLQKTGLLTYDSILTDEQFRNNDGSMSYPVSGLYNSFLLGELGGVKYLELYRKVNGSRENVKSINPLQLSLPQNKKFEKFMTDYQNDKVMYVDEKNTVEPEFRMQGSKGYFVSTNEYIKFYASSVYSIGFSVIQTDKGYISRKYVELYNDDYRSMKYCITASAESINIYNLFNDELMYSYNKGISIDTINIPRKDGFYNFFIKSDLFEEDFENKMIILDGTVR